MKKTVTAIAISITIVVSLAPALVAQSKKGKTPSGPTPLEVTIKQIADRRTSSHFSQLDLSLELSGITAGDVSAARVVVKKAVDDTGLDLLDPERGEPRFEATSHGYYSEEASTEPATVDVVLKNPSRDAVVIREVSGEIELYMPTKDPAATAAIPKFQSSAGKPIASKELKASGVEIVVMGAAQLEAEKQKGAKAKAEELKKEGYDAESIEYSVKSFEEYFYVPEEGEVALKIKDPNARIHEMVLIDSAGEQQQVYSSDRDGMTILSTYGSPIEADWTLKVSLRTPKTLARHTFALADVELP